MRVELCCIGPVHGDIAVYCHEINDNSGALFNNETTTQGDVFKSSAHCNRARWVEADGFINSVLNKLAVGVHKFAVFRMLFEPGKQVVECAYKSSCRGVRTCKKEKSNFTHESVMLNMEGVFVA